MPPASKVGHAKVLAWGGSIGLRISKAEAKRLGIKVGQEFLFTPAKPVGIDWSNAPVFRDGRGRLDHDRIVAEAVSRELGLGPMPPEDGDEGR